MAAKDKNANVKYYAPSTVLRKKVGIGGIDPHLLEKAEHYIDSNAFDFTPLAQQIFLRLEKAVAEVEASKVRDRSSIEKIAGPVMELKANAGMFGYPLISGIANVVLNFLESITELHEDALAIVKIHQKSVRVILLGKIKGEGGKEGRALADELLDACKRYYKKHNVKPVT